MENQAQAKQLIDESIEVLSSYIDGHEDFINVVDTLNKLTEASELLEDS